MRNLNIIFSAAVLSALCACHTAYNTGGHSWVKTKSLPITHVSHSKPVLLSNNIPSTQPVAPEDLAITASTGYTTPVLINQMSAKPALSVVKRSPSLSKFTASTHVAKATKSAKSVPFGEPLCSQRTAFYLSLPPFGLFGFHRFYLGYTFIGILQILTVGGLGLWTLIDIIRIYKGTLAAKDHYIYRRTWYD